MAVDLTQLPLFPLTTEAVSPTGAEEEDCACGCSKCDDPASNHGHCGNEHRGCHYETGSIGTLQSKYRVQAFG